MFLFQELPGFENNPKQFVSKNQQFVNVLQAASDNRKPLYLLSKTEIDKELKK